ncbi:MAG: IS3 family transposase [Acidimicrobiales bacterium]
MHYIDEPKEVFEVEPICEELQIAPTYCAMKTRPPSKMCRRHQAMKERIEEVFDQNYRVYGIHKIWKQLRREGKAEEVELATLPYVNWFNSSQLQTEIGDIPPAEFEATYSRQKEDAPEPPKSKRKSLFENQGALTSYMTNL